MVPYVDSADVKIRSYSLKAIAALLNVVHLSVAHMLQVSMVKSAVSFPSSVSSFVKSKKFAVSMV
jgi:hypothetical protein